MVSAYDRTTWNIKPSPSTQIAAVYASGYSRQTVTGVDPRVPQLISTYDNRGRCGYFYATEEKLADLNPHARKVFGRAADAFYPIGRGPVLMGIKLPQAVQVARPAAPPPSYPTSAAPRPSRPALDQAVAAGLLRRATRADSDAWFAALAKAAQYADAPPVAGGGTRCERSLPVYNAYVVLKPFSYPDGLFGGNYATFMIPKGAPRPSGDPGHSPVYDFNTMVCTGSLCTE